MTKFEVIQSTKS